MKYNLEKINESISENIIDILDYFDIDYAIHSKYINFPCPIHCGDNDSGASILLGDSLVWKCFTNQCHNDYGNGIINFITALLDTRENKKHNFVETLEWIINFTKCDAINKEEDKEDFDKTNFIQLCKYINRNKKSVPTFTPRELVKTFLKIPAEYYINRGYGEEVLHKFDVGYCFNPNKSFYDRIITPFYDEDGRYMIGCSGRSKHEQCPKCKLYHLETTRCPLTKDERLRATKWKHNSSFPADAYLYNYWNAKAHILKTNTVILVEGSGDVWRLEEGGIYNSLGLLGAKFTQDQQIILEQSGALNLLIATDNDEAGNKIVTHITEKCKKLFNIKRVQYPGKDPGGLTIEQVKEIFIPILERI